MLVVGCAADNTAERTSRELAAAIAGSIIRVGADSIVADRVLQIGQLDGSVEYTFGRIASIAPAPDSGFYVCDEAEPAIRQYAADGAFVRIVGRRGGGPGEYQMCDNLVVDAVDSSLVISDPSNGRLTRVAPDDSVLPAIMDLTASGLFGRGSSLIDLTIWAGFGCTCTSRPSLNPSLIGRPAMHVRC